MKASTLCNSYMCVHVPAVFVWSAWLLLDGGLIEDRVIFVSLQHSFKRLLLDQWVELMQSLLHLIQSDQSLTAVGH